MLDAGVLQRGALTGGSVLLKLTSEGLAPSTGHAQA